MEHDLAHEYAALNQGDLKISGVVIYSLLPRLLTQDSPRK